MDPNKGKTDLVNRMSPEELIKKLSKETFKRKTVSFYRYIIIDNPQKVRDDLYQLWSKLNCLGRIYIAHEGINAQMNVPEHNWEKFTTLIHDNIYLKDIPFKIAVEDDGKSFIKLQVKVRNKIVADGLSNNEYDVTNVGKHLNALEWNQAMEQGATVVDMRNFYESEIGYFEGALLPQAETFAKELPEVLNLLKGKENEKVLLYCTGGVRCEKTSAYLKHHGFNDVNQLYGGIINYKHEMDHLNKKSKFKGKNFVFDNRLGERISNEIVSHCHQCGKPCDTHTNCANIRCNLLFIQCPECTEKYHNTCSDNCNEYVLSSPQKQIELEQINTYKPLKRYYRKV